MFYHSPYQYIVYDLELDLIESQNSLTSFSKLPPSPNISVHLTQQDVAGDEVFILIRYEDLFIEIYSDKDEHVLHRAKIDSMAISQCPDNTNYFVIGSYFLDVFNLSKGMENHLTCLIL